MPTDPRHVPNYAPAEAARYLRMPASTLRAWTRGWKYAVQDGQEQRRSLPLIPLDGEDASLSFANLVEAHVLLAIRRQHGIPMHRVRDSLDYLCGEMGHRRPLLEAEFATDGVDLIVEHLGHLVNVSREGQTHLRGLLAAHLRRIDRDERGLAARLYPYTRTSDDDLDQPRLIVVDPERAFGRPAIADSGIPTGILAERYLAGESFRDLAADYELDAGVIEEAIRCEMLPAA